MSHSVLRSPASGGLVLLSLLAGSAHAQDELVVWRNDLAGEISDAPTEADFVQVSGGYQFVAARRFDGSLVAWGLDSDGQASGLPAGAGFTQVACGWRHGVALRADGSLVSWGSDDYGAVTQTPTGTGYTAVSAGLGHSLALRADGSIEGWGWDDNGQVSSAPTESGFTQIDAGAFSSIGLRADGSIAVWGPPATALLMTGVPTESGFTQVSLAGAVALALRPDGSIAAWGSDNGGLVSGAPTESGFVQVEAGGFRALALRPDGTIVEWGPQFPQGPGTPLEGGHTRVEGGHGATFYALRPIVPGAAYCGAGDGGAYFCPCGATGAFGEGCANSTGAGAVLAADGYAWLSNDTFALQVTGAPANRPGLVLRGAVRLNNGLGSPVGDGRLCVSGQTARSQVQSTGAGGGATFADFQGQGLGATSYGAGVPTHYQFWYRDPANACSGSGFNFSNAWTVTWQM